MKTYNISEEMYVVANVSTSKKGNVNLILELRSPKREFYPVSLTGRVVSMILENKAAIENGVNHIAKNPDVEKAFPFGNATLIAYRYQSKKTGLYTPSLEISGLQFPNPHFPVVVALQILAHGKELKQIIADNPIETAKKDEMKKESVKAEKALKQNAATMPTDKKSPMSEQEYAEIKARQTSRNNDADWKKEQKESAQATTEYAPGTLTDFASWMSANYDVTKEQARQWIDDKEYQSEFIAYLETCKVVARPQKRVTIPSVPQRPAKRETSAAIQRFEKETGQKFNAAPKEKAKKGRGIPVSFSVMTNVGKTNITRANSGIDAIRLLKGKTLIHPQTKETRLIDDRGENNSHWYATNVKDGYIFDVKRLDA